MDDLNSAITLKLIRTIPSCDCDVINKQVHKIQIQPVFDTMRLTDLKRCENGYISVIVLISPTTGGHMPVYI